MQERVIIVGGGLAGLAAAVGLAGSGLQVTLLESRPRWGGRASSFVDATTGETIDNCQHVSMGCCTNFAHFCRVVGIDDCFQREAELHFIGPDGHDSVFSSVPLPAPLHLFPAFLRLKYLSLHDKWRLAWGLRALARTDPRGATNESIANWLKNHRQTPATIERFWHVVLVSALSESLDRIHVAAARKVFVDGFLANRHGWEVLLPTVPLDELYGQRLTAWFVEKKVATRLQCGVKRVLLADGTTRGVELRSGETLDAEYLILAVPQNLVSAMLRDVWSSHRAFADLDRLESAPISSVHLWFDRAITSLRHASFIGRTSQWLFNRSLIQQGDRKIAATPPLGLGGQEGSGDNYYQVVISASREITQRSQEETIRHVVAELAGVWPVVREAELRHARLVTEHRAALSMKPGVESLRPAQQSAIANLQLAGDWTQTGWPSTMEGAVRSGFRAAENVLRLAGCPRSLLQPDLPVARLSRILLRLPSRQFPP